MNLDLFYKFIIKYLKSYINLLNLIADLHVLRLTGDVKKKISKVIVVYTVKALVTRIKPSVLGNR
jgi:hypothetical protein